MLIACLDDAWSHDFISSSVRTLENSKDAPLCIPHVNLCLEPMNEIYYSISLEDNYFSGSRPMRFWKTLRSFPSVGWYGLYRMSAVREVGPIPISIAGDLVFLQKLSLAGEFRHSSNAVLTFSVPKQWNTREQDFAFFYGNSKRPWLKRPFLIVLGTQLSSISKMKISPIHKFVFLTQILLNLLLDKTAILFFQALKFFPIYEDTKKCIVSILYRRFLKPKWLIIVAKDLFFNREIYGRFGYNKSQNTRCVN
jgi:hypothetical protein